MSDFPTTHADVFYIEGVKVTRSFSHAIRAHVFDIEGNRYLEDEAKAVVAKIRADAPRKADEERLSALYP